LSVIIIWALFSFFMWHVWRRGGQISKLVILLFGFLFSFRAGVWDHFSAAKQQKNARETYVYRSRLFMLGLVFLIICSPFSYSYSASFLFRMWEAGEIVTIRRVEGQLFQMLVGCFLVELLFILMLGVWFCFSFSLLLWLSLSFLSLSSLSLFLLGQCAIG
jgi:hypothetical protein